MELQTHAPPFTAPAEVDAQLRERGHAVLALNALPASMPQALQRWAPLWARLPSDEPAFAEARERLVASLRALGMRP